MLLLGAGPRALLLQIAHPAVAAGVNDHSDFRADPWRRLAGTLRSYLTIVYGSTSRRARRDPAAQHAPSRDHRAWLRGARPRALAVGPRDAGRLDDGGRRRVAGTAVAGAPGRVLRRDPADREGVRGAGRAVAAGCRGIRPVRGGDAGPRRAGARLADRPRAGRRHPPAATRAARSAAATPDVRRASRARAGAARRPMPGPCGRRSGCCRHPSATTTALRGAPANGSCRPGWSPAFAPGDRCCPRRSGRCPRHSPRIGG